MKKTKELKNVLNAIDKYIDKHKVAVDVVASFIAFDVKNDYEAIDDVIVGYGNKDGLQIALKDLTSMAKKETDFINW